MKTAKFVLLLAALLFLSSLPFTAMGLSQDSFALVDENSRLALYVDPLSGQVIVENKADGYLWRTNPEKPDKKAKGVHKMTLQSQLVLNYQSDRGTALSAPSQVESVNKDGLTVRIENKTAVCRYDFVKAEIAVTVIYRLKDGYVEVSVPVDGLETRGVNTVSSLDIWPAFDSQDIKAQGYLFVPDGSGALIRYNNGVASMAEYKAQLYGKDYGVEGQVGSASVLQMTAPKNEAVARLPVFGSGGRDHGFLAVITQNDAKAVIHARVSNLTSYNYVYSEFQVRSTGSIMMYKKEFDARVTGVSEREGLTTGAYTVRYYCLTGEKESAYAGMAEKYRDYLMKEQGLTQRVQAGQYPLYLNVYGYVKKQAQFLGFPYTKAALLTTVSDIEDMADGLDIPQTVVRYLSWVKDSAFEKIPQSVELQSGLGTKEQLAALSQKLQDLGGGLFTDFDLTRAYKGGNGFNALWDAVLSPVNAPQMQYQLNYDNAAVNGDIPPWYLLSPSRYRLFAGRLMEKFKALNIPNLSLDGLGDICTSDNRTGGTGRGSVPQIVRDALNDVMKVSPNLMLSGGNGYAAALASHLVDVPGSSSDYAICDETVPFYQMVFHGFIPYAMGAMNHYSSPREAVLKCLEYGASPMYSFVKQNKEELLSSRMMFLYSPDFDAWRDTVKQDYDTLFEVLSRVAAERMTGHERMSGTLTRTDYETLAVYVNFSGEALLADGKIIPALGFLAVEVNAP
jgi:hypothetical protein